MELYELSLRIKAEGTTQAVQNLKQVETAGKKTADGFKQTAQASANAFKNVDAQIKSMQRQFDFSAARIKEGLARGFLTKEQAAQAGREAAQAYNNAVLRTIDRASAAGPISGAQREAFTRLAGSIKNVGAEGTKASGGLRTLQSNLIQIASNVSGLNPQVARLASSIGLLTAGGAIVVGVTLGITAIAAVYDKLTSSARAADKAQKDLIERFTSAADARKEASLEGKAGNVETLGRLRQEAFDELQNQRRKAQTLGTSGLTLGSQAAIDKAQAALNQRIKAFNEAVSQNVEAIRGALPATVTKATSGGGSRGSGATARAGSLIPDFDFGRNVGSDVMDRIGQIGQGEFDVLAPIRKRFEDTPEELDKIMRELNATIAAGPMKRFQEDMNLQIGSMLGQTLGDAVYNAFAAAFNGEGLSGIFAAFGKTVLAGIGQIFTMMGQQYISYGVLMAGLVPSLTNPFTAGPAAIAIGTALVAMGAALGAVANSGGSRGSSRAGGFRDRSNSQEIVRLKFVDRPGYADKLAPATPMHFTIIGENDPRAQRMIGNIVEKNSRRKG